MAKKKGFTARSSGVLEWAHGELTATVTGTPAVGEIDLDLMQDEIAEIWKIDAEISWDNLVPEVDENEFATAILSMNPDLAVAVLPDDEIGDLETIFYMASSYNTGLAGTGANFQGQNRTIKKLSDFNVKPLLVGTNIGTKCIFTSTTADNLWFDVHVYFTRRKANATELNQILLKRR